MSGDIICLSGWLARERWTCCMAFVTAHKGRGKVRWRRFDSGEGFFGDARRLPTLIPSWDLISRFSDQKLPKQPDMHSLFPFDRLFGKLSIVESFSFFN